MDVHVGDAPLVLTGGYSAATDGSSHYSTYWIHYSRTIDGCYAPIFFRSPPQYNRIYSTQKQMISKCILPSAEYVVQLLEG